MALILALGFAGYQYFSGRNLNIQSENGQNSFQQAPKEAEKKDDTVDSEGEIEVITGGGGGLTICADKCGDGVCQSQAEECENLNCICFEDKQECPQDCK